MKLRFSLLSLLLIVTALLCSVENARAESAQTWLVNAGHFDCIPVENFGLKGLRLWAPEETIRKLLGEPSSISQGDSEDDGGPYNINIYHYPDIKVEAVREHIDRIIATSTSVTMPSGIRLGDSRRDVVDKFGRRPRSLSPDVSEIHLVTCPVSDKWVQEDYVTLEFSSEGILTEIRYEANRP